MKAISIVSLVFAGISIFIPIVGVYIAVLCSLLAMVSFRSEPTLSGITFGINIINTAFLSPSLIIVSKINGTVTEPNNLYFIYLGAHFALLIAGIAFRIIRGSEAPK